jgi:Ca-activated chloride channel homolog
MDSSQNNRPPVGRGPVPRHGVASPSFPSPAGRGDRGVRPPFLLALFLSLPFLLAFTLPGEFARLMDAGNAHYGKGKFKEAAAEYDKALQIRPEEPQALFDRGAARFRLGNYEKALADCDKSAASAQGQLKQYAEYNAGNCLYRMQKTEDAITRYKRALVLNPDDMFAKHNLEFAQRKQDQDKNKDKDKDKDKKQDKNKEKKQDPKQDQQQQEQPKPQEQKAQPQPADQRQLTPEQAQQLLSSLAKDDADMQKLMHPTPLTPERPTNKDW